MSELTLNIASQTIPNWNQWMPRVVEFLEQPQNGVWVQALNSAGIDSQAAADRTCTTSIASCTAATPGRAPAQQPSRRLPRRARRRRPRTPRIATPRDENGRFVSDPGRRQGRLATSKGSTS
jgi:hypothetical protein